MKCQENHQHHQIAGNTFFHGHGTSLSRFTELYPRKFARQIIQSLRKDRTRKLGIFAAKDEDHPTKRRRLGQKGSLSQIQLLSNQVTWDDIMKAADSEASEAPRVGPKVVTEGHLIQAVQRLFPDHIFNHLVLRRGMDRMVGPDTKISPGVAPLRKFACIRRRFEKNHC